MNRWRQPQKVSEGAYFLIDVAQFTSPVVKYDARLANQSLTYVTGNSHDADDATGDQDLDEAETPGVPSPGVSFSAPW